MTRSPSCALPDGAGPHPVVVLIHGGAWKAIWRKDLMAAMAVDLARRGLATWNIEFRRLGDGGGWPTTFEDVADAIGALQGLTEQRALDPSRVVFVGHSSGGHLALWAAAAAQDAETTNRGRLARRDRQTWSRAHDAGCSGARNVVAKLLGGGPDEVPERYATASPRALLPLGDAPDARPGSRRSPHRPRRSEPRHTRATAGQPGDSVRLVEIEGATHMDLIEPSSAAWAVVVRGDRAVLRVAERSRGRGRA